MTSKLLCHLHRRSRLHKPRYIRMTQCVEVGDTSSGVNASQKIGPVAIRRRLLIVFDFIEPSRPRRRQILTYHPRCVVGHCENWQRHRAALQPRPQHCRKVGANGLDIGPPMLAIRRGNGHGGGGVIKFEGLRRKAR